MNKKDYQKPTMNVVKIQQAQMLRSSPVELTGVQTTGTDWNTDDDFTFGDGWGGSSR